MFTLEMTGPRCGPVYVQPLGRPLRSRFRWEELGDPEAVKKFALDRPPVIPGQRLRVDPDAGAAEIIDPLHDPEHRAIRERLLKRFTLPPAREEVKGADAATFVFWSKRLIEAGFAVLVEGAIPERVPGKPQKLFVFPEPTDRRDRRLDALTAFLLASLPADKRRQAEELLASIEGDDGG